MMSGVVQKGFWYDLWRRGYLLAHVEAGLAPEHRFQVVVERRMGQVGTDVDEHARSISSGMPT